MTDDDDSDDVCLGAAALFVSPPGADGCRRVTLMDNGLSPRYRTGEVLVTTTGQIAPGDDVLVAHSDGGFSVVRLVSVNRVEMAAASVNGTGGIATLELTAIAGVQRVAASVHPDMAQLPAGAILESLDAAGTASPTLH
jgi:hypothetical protein